MRRLERGGEEYEIKDRIAMLVGVLAGSDLRF